MDNINNTDDLAVKQQQTPDTAQSLAQNDEASAEQEQLEEPAQANPRSKYNKFAVFGIILAVCAWIVLSFEGRVAWAISIPAVVSSCIGLRAATRPLRNTAITALVASAVLLIVVSAFLFIILISF